MLQRIHHLAAAGAATALAAALTAGCGSASPGPGTGTTTAPVQGRSVDTAQVEQGIEQDLSTSSVKVDSASCPSDVPVQVGSTFTCTVHLSNGGSGKVTVTQQPATTYTYAFQDGSVQVPGSAADSAIEQQLAAQGAPDATVTCPENIIVKVGTTVTCNVSGAQGVAGGTVTFSFSSADGEVDPSSVESA